MYLPGFNLEYHPLPTPDTAPEDVVLRTYRIPNDPLWLGLLNGVISLLFYPDFWVKSGTATVEEVTQIFQEMYLNDDTPTGASMLGMVAHFGVWDLPEGWLYCNGDAHTKAAYPALWEVWPSSRKDDTTFTLYDMRTRFVVGAGMPDPWPLYSLGQTGGDNWTELTEAQMPEHTHEVQKAGVVQSDPPLTRSRLASPHTRWEGQDSLPAGSGEAHENRPPFLALIPAVCALE